MPISMALGQIYPNSERDTAVVMAALAELMLYHYPGNESYLAMIDARDAYDLRDDVLRWEDDGGRC